MAPSSLLIRQAPPASMDDTLVGEIIAIAVAFTVISTLGLIARMVSVYMRKASCQVDDFLLILAWIISTAHSGMCIWGAYWGGLGHHYATLGPEEIVSFEKVTTPSSIRRYER